MFSDIFNHFNISFREKLNMEILNTFCALNINCNIFTSLCSNTLTES